MSDIKTLLLHLDAAPTSIRRLPPALRLARDLDARLQALYAVLPLAMQYPYALAAGGDAVAQLADCEAEVRAQAKAAFESACTAAGASDIAWTQASDDPVRALARLAFGCDLMVLGQHDPNAPVATGVPADFVASMLVATGKPALVLPYIDIAPDFGKVVLVAWKATPESARALTAALPLLQRARSVHLACWDEADDPTVDPTQSAEQFLQRHGIAAELHREGAPTRDLGEMLLSKAADLQADLLVMGCYGHGRAREWALGGVTRTVLRAMTVPVLMAH